MSAITILDRALGPDGARRYKTRWKILVKSHQHNNTVDLSKALVTVNTTKTTKSVGNLSMSLVADRDYLNYVFPNDYIAAYCDKGDGQGWTRVHFGFVDNITEIDRVDAAGKPTTLYTIVCSDFQKAFERTQLYFNPHVAARPDFDGNFIGTTNMGGAALRTRGLLAHGSPADVVVNVILLLMGFGGQFILPASFVPRNLNQIRAQRAEFALGLLSEDIRRQVLDLGGYQAFLDQIKTQAGFDDTISTDQLLRTDPESPLAGDIRRNDRQRFSLAAQRALDGRGPNDTGGNGLPLNGGEAFSILNTTVSSAPPTLLDIIDLSTFVERNAIDGYFAELSIWERQDSVWSFINSVSNEIVNELFLDLRPLSRDGGLTVGTDFSRELDELGGNEADVGVNGICHVPALIMREYPFSTIDRIDAQNVPITVVQSSTSATSFTGNAIGNLGTVIFGAIFSDRPNEPGRHVITIPTISVQARSNGTSPETAQKHLDVAVVHNTEIISTSLSRSDTDHFNLIEMVSESALSGEASRFYMRDLSPLITPVAIVRHGLRKRTLNTRCARGGLDLANRVTTVNEPEQALAETTTPAPASSVTVLPVALVEADGVLSQGFVTPENQWWYRPKETRFERPVNNNPNNITPAAGTRYWRFHNGVDIHAPRGTPVRAVRDGLVCMALPQRPRSPNVVPAYGNCVYIFHPQDNMYTLYGHLDRFAENVQPVTRARSSSNLAPFQSTRLNARGGYTEVPVRAGDVIGYVGNTDAEPVDRPETRVDESRFGVHLHFEFNIERNGRSYSSMSDRNRLAPDRFRDAVPAGAPAVSSVLSPTRPPNPDESLTVSQDPVRVFRELFGVTLPVGTAGLLSPDDEVEVTDGGEEAHLPETPPTPGTRETTDTTTSTQQMYTHVDTAMTRRQLARWTLLHDHWYQHNIEYVSGNIEMRGAPEIRAGYRLDLPDRNMSFYVESVSHTWNVDQHMTTNLQVTRGQPTNPHPVYVCPALEGLGATETQRRVNSRLGAFFMCPDPVAVRRALTVRKGTQVVPAQARVSAAYNETDFGERRDNYNETLIDAVTGTSDPNFAAELREAEARSLGITSANNSSSGFSTNPASNSTYSDALARVRRDGI